MARELQETFHGYNRPSVWVAVGGREYRGEIRASATDADSATNRGCVWWAQCNVHYATGETRIEWHPVDRVRLDLDRLASLEFVRFRPVDTGGQPESD